MLVAKSIGPHKLWLNNVVHHDDHDGSLGVCRKESCLKDEIKN